jgi:adenylate cyclase
VLALYDAEALRDDPLDRRLLVLSILAQARLLLGHAAESRRLEDAALSAARERGVATDLAFTLTTLFQLCVLRRDAEAVLESAREVVELCAQHKLEMFGATTEVYVGWALTRVGSADEGLARVRDGLRRGHAAGLTIGSALLIGRLADACAAAGHAADALAAVEDALGAVGEEEVWRPDLLGLRGDLLAHQGDDVAAEAAYRDALERAHAMGALLFELRAATGIARLLHRRGRAGEAHALLAPVYTRFTDGFELRDLVEARAILDALGVPGTT